MSCVIDRNLVRMTVKDRSSEGSTCALVAVDGN
jgi:hypothetical protein